MSETKDDLGIKNVTLLEQTMPGGVVRKLEASSAYDLRSHPKNYGIHCMDHWWSVQRGNVAVTWRLFSGWWLEQNRESGQRVPDGLGSIDRHSPVPLYEFETPQHDCKYTGGDCYCDGTSLGSTDLFNKFLLDPDEVWRTLEEWLVETEGRIEKEKSAARDLS
jgi:hypothetical protein